MVVAAVATAAAGRVYVEDSKALVMLSGGLDSATCLYWARSRFKDVSAITFNYFGRLKNEKRAAERLARHARVSQLIEIDLPFVKETSDFNSGGKGRGRNGRSSKNGNSGGRHPGGKAALAGGGAMPLLLPPSSAYVPARNMIFYSIAAHHAEYMGFRWIVGGHNAHDAKLFPDASPRYVEKLNLLFREGCMPCNREEREGGGRLRSPADGRRHHHNHNSRNHHNHNYYQIVLPLSRMDRRKVIRLAMDLGTPIELTWSCHSEGSVHCGRCYACRQRIDAFGSLGLQDPAFPAGAARR